MKPFIDAEIEIILLDSMQVDTIQASDGSGDGDGNLLPGDGDNWLD